MTLEELKAGIATVEIRDGRRVFPMELREAALKHTHEQVAAGRTLSAVARELGLVECTLGRWRQIARGEVPVKPTLGFVEVSVSAAKVKPQMERAHFAVKCPSGHEISVPFGFEAAALKELLQTVGSL